MGKHYNYSKRTKNYFSFFKNKLTNNLICFCVPNKFKKINSAFLLLIISNFVFGANSITVSSLSASQTCFGTSATITVTFTKSGSFSGNTFTAQLSNSSGSFTSPTNIGSIVSNNAMPINATIPSGISVGSGYLVRVIANSPNIVSLNSLGFTVNPTNTINLASTPGTNNQTICFTSAISNITYSTTSATGASFSGLPAGVVGSWASNTVTISGTPSVSGIFNYVITLTGGCGTISATGTITVKSLPVITCPGNITVTAPTGSCSAVVSFTATATGTPTPTISYSIAPGSVFNVGTTTVIATASNSCSATCSFTVTVLPGSTDYWLGGVSNDWFTAANWCSGLPSATTAVEISSGAAYMPIISSAGAQCKNISINSGASLTMNSTGSLTVNGNWITNGTFTATSGFVNFAGTVAQSITGSTSFYNLYLNNSSGLTLNSSSNITVNRGAQLNAGIITTNSNIVSIENGASLFVLNGYVNGYLKKYISSGMSISETFEVGSSTAYTPLSIEFNNVTTSGTLTINTVSADHPNISTSGFDISRTINRHWKILNAGVTFDTYNLDVNYASADKDAGFIDMYTGAKIYSASGSWSMASPSYTASNTASLMDLTQLGDVQIGIFNPAPMAFTITPASGYTGQTTDVIVNGKGFIQGATNINSIAGVTINSSTVNNDSTLTLNISVNSSAVTGLRKVAIKNLSPVGGTSDSLSFTIRKTPIANFYGNRSVITCNVSGDVEFQNYSSDGASYYWDFGAGATPATAMGAGPYTVTYSSTGYKTVKLIAFSPIGNDTLTRVNYIKVNASVPAAATSISGPTTICPTGINRVYTVPSVVGISSYNWTVPAGGTIISGNGTRSISVSFISSFTNGNVSVKETNGCGTGGSRSLMVTGIPPAPSSISGPVNICSLTSATYTAAAVNGATSYTWTLPTGVTSAAGTSPVTTTSNSIILNFAPGTVSGILYVKANNACASGIDKSLIMTSTPGSPASITGPALTCNLTTATYSIPAVNGATSYTWTFPSGTTSTSGSSPLTISGTSLSIDFGPSFISGTLSVIANNACANGTAKTITIKNAPNTPGTISGPAIVCGLTSATYSTTPVSGAVSYTWTLPAGVTSTIGASPITITGTTLAVEFASTFTTGTISLKANSNCASSISRAITVKTTPNIPGVITGPASVCSISTANYSVASVIGASGYNWTVPAGITILSGQGTNNISVSIMSGFTSGSVYVKDTNACAKSAARTLALSGCHSYTSNEQPDNVTPKAIETKMYPNPGTDNFNIEFSSETTSQMTIEMFDVLGKSIFEKTEPVIQGQNIFNYETFGIEKGMYFIKLTDEQNNIKETKIFIIESH